MFQRILVAADGSRSAFLAARKAIALAAQFSARLKIVVVIDQRVFYMPHDIIPDNSPFFKILKDLRKGAAQISTRIEKEAQSAGLTHVEVEILEGTVVDEILNAVRNFKSDLLIIGAIGKTGESRGVLGSTAQALAVQAPCSILIVRQ